MKAGTGWMAAEAVFLAIKVQTFILECLFSNKSGCFLLKL